MECLFGDCVIAIRGCSFDVMIYAYDCNACKWYSRQVSNAMIESDIRSCQRSLHKWEQANCVVVDAGKKQIMVISIANPSGGSVKVLGIDFDSKMVMSTAAHKCATKAARKTMSLLRVRRFYSVSDLLLLYKSHGL